MSEPKRIRIDSLGPRGLGRRRKALVHQAKILRRYGWKGHGLLGRIAKGEVRHVPEVLSIITGLEFLLGRSQIVDLGREPAGIFGHQGGSANGLRLRELEL